MDVDSQPFVIFFVFLFLDLIVVLVQSSLLNARMPQLMNLRVQYPSRVEQAVSLLEKLRLRVALRILTIAIHFMLALTLWRLLSAWLLPAGEANASLTLPYLAVAGAALLILMIEFGVESLVLKSPEAWALRAVPLARLLDLILTPLSALLVLILGAAPGREHRAAAVTDDELKTWVSTGQQEGTLEKEERQMIYSIFQFGDTLVREIMVPRIDILALDVTTSLQDAIQAFTDSGHSRLPVYEETIDNIRGLLYAKDLLRFGLFDENGQSISQYLREAYFVPEAKKVDDLLREMRERSIHMAIVVDEYGGMAGLVTLEDIVEEIFGEIRDEYDQSEELLYQQISPDEFLFHGRIDVEDVNDTLEIHLSRETADTLGGYLYSAIGRVPVGGEEVPVENWTLKIEHVSGRRIRKVRALRREIVPTDTSQEKTNDKR